jgi:hypothetical protein
MKLAGASLPPLESMTEALFQHYYKMVLTPTEATELGWYLKTRGQGSIVALNQGESRSRGVGTPASSEILHTQIMHNGIQWDTNDGTFLTPTDVLLTQGFPCRLAMSSGTECCSFVYDRQRSRTSTTGHAGNSMNVHVAGIMVMFACMFVNRTDDVPLHDLVAIGLLPGPNAWAGYLSTPSQPCQK